MKLLILIKTWHEIGSGTLSICNIILMKVNFNASEIFTLNEIWINIPAIEEDKWRIFYENLI